MEIAIPSLRDVFTRAKLSLMTTWVSCRLSLGMCITDCKLKYEQKTILSFTIIFTLLNLYHAIPTFNDLEKEAF